MSEITTTVRVDSDGEPYIAVAKAVTLDDLAARMDILGQQMNWLCENLQSLFGFVNQMSQNGGGIRGMMKALKQQEAIVTKEAPGEQH